MLNIRNSIKSSMIALTGVFILGSFSLQADCCEKSKPIKIVGEAAPEVKKMIRRNRPFPYRQIYQNLTKNDNIPTLEQDLINLYNFLALEDMSGAEAAYQKLYNDALSIVANYCPSQSLPPRVVITATNGVVVVDTEKSGTDNTLDNFLAGLIDENFNTRIAMLDAQAWPAGVGVETQFNFTKHRYGSAVAVRLGPYLANQGTVRLAVFP